MDQLYKKIAALRDEFTEETGTKVNNSQGEPDVDYVDWLEKRIVTPDSKAVIMPTPGEVYKEAEWRATNGHGALDDYSMSIFINACEWFRSQVREVELKSIDSVMAGLTDEEIKKAFRILHPAKNEETEKICLKVAKYALSQLKTVNLKDELVKFLNDIDPDFVLKRNQSTVKTVEDYLHKAEEGK